MFEKIKTLEAELLALNKRRAALEKELKVLHHQYHQPSLGVRSEETRSFSKEEKINLFMEFFKGRDDVFAKRWDNAKTGKSGYSPLCSNEWVKGVCNKPRIKCSNCPNQAFIPLKEEVIYKHLGGEDYGNSKRDYTIGIYPMLKDDTCWFLALDLDKDQWQRDAAAFIKTCQVKSIPFALERSRSGNGAHVWIFFSEPILASEARKLGAALLTETMENYPEIGFESYDRFFPNQDTLPTGGFGNLIALPLQRFPRDKGNSVFLDETFTPYPDQWAFLYSLLGSSGKLSKETLNRFVEEASRKGKILGVRMSLEEDEKPWEMKPSRRASDMPLGQALPEVVKIVLSNQVFVEKKGLPPALILKIIRLASFQNPEFYRAQSMRLQTFGKPRIITCAEDFMEYIGLPRGCLEEIQDLFESLGVKILMEDKRENGQNIQEKGVVLNFLGELTNEQQKAAEKLLETDSGVLHASTGFGKTVVGAYMIAKRKVGTLIIVHRQELLKQWVGKLKEFLNLETHQIGVIGGRKYKPTGIIDVATIQSLIKGDVVKDVVADLLADYGHVIVDECHHLPAITFEKVIKASRAKYVLGLTATPTRKDGHHPIMFMQCGPIRYKANAVPWSFTHRVIVKDTSFTFDYVADEKLSINDIYSAMIHDRDRNSQIIEDIKHVLRDGKSPLVLTERKDHALFLETQLTQFCKNVILMMGGQKTQKQTEMRQHLERLSDTDERIIIATGRYIGEGFDDARLDTLFLTMPISWYGTLSQYAGRLHRNHIHKKEVIIYDYVDRRVPSLKRMFEKRLKGYGKMAYYLDDPKEGSLFSSDGF